MGFPGGYVGPSVATTCVRLISKDTGHYGLPESLGCLPGIKKDPARDFVSRTIITGGKVR